MKRYFAFIHRALPYGLYILLVGFLFRNALFMQGGYLFGWDVMDLTYPLYQLFHDSITNGVMPFWNPYLMAGHPYAGIAATVAYPLFWLFALFPVPFALTLYYVFHILLAMIGMYRLCLRWIGGFTSFFAGAVYGLSGFFFPRILAGVPDHIAVGALLPFAVMGVFRIVDHTSLKKAVPGIAQTGMFWGLMIIAGDQRLCLMAAAMFFVLAVLYVFKHRSYIPLLGVVLACVIGLGIGAVQLIPLWEYLNQSIRSSGLSYEWASGGSLTRIDLSQLLYPFTKTYEPNTNYYPPYPEGPFYAGVSALFLAIAGVLSYSITCVRHRCKHTIHGFVVMAFALIAVLSIWTAMGPDAWGFDIYRLLWKYVPFFSVIRVPHRFVLIFIFSVAILSGFAVDRIRKRAPRYILAGVLLLELLPFASSQIIPVPWPQIGYDEEVVRILKAGASSGRLHQNFLYTQRLGRVLDFNSPTALKIPSTNGNLPLILRDYAEFYLALTGIRDSSVMFDLKQLPPFAEANPQLINFLSVRYLLSTGDFRPSDQPDLLMRIDNPYRWMTLVENTAAYPHHYPVRDAVYLQDGETIRNRLAQGGYDLSRTIFLEQDDVKPLAPCEDTSPGTVRMLEGTVNEVKLAVDIPCEAYIVSSDVMYPGWKAYLDGKEVPIRTANLAFRSVRAPAGVHNLEYRFVPYAFVIGLAISIATFVFILSVRNKVR